MTRVVYVVRQMGNEALGAMIVETQWEDFAQTMINLQEYLTKQYITWHLVSSCWFQVDFKSKMWWIQTVFGSNDKDLLYTNSEDQLIENQDALVGVLDKMKKTTTHVNEQSENWHQPKGFDGIKKFHQFQVEFKKGKFSDVVNCFYHCNSAGPDGKYIISESLSLYELQKFSHSKISTNFDFPNFPENLTPLTF